MFQKRICTKIVSLLLVIGCLMSEPVLAEKQKEPEAQTLYSKSCAMVDGDSGRLLYVKEEQTEPFRKTVSGKYHKNSDLYRGDGTM